MPDIDHSLMAVGGEWLHWHKSSALTSNWLIISIAVLVIVVSANEENSVENADGKWKFNCQDVDDVSNYRKIVVTWTLNNAIWLKIDHGNLTVVNRLTTFTKQHTTSERQLNIYTILANDARYEFSYNEVEGKFSMSIQNGKLEDVGFWQCHVTLFKKDNQVEEFSTQDSFNLESENGVTKWTYWNIETQPVEDEEKFPPSVLDEESSFNSTAPSLRFYYMVPLLITIPSVIVF